MRLDGSSLVYCRRRSGSWRKPDGSGSETPRRLAGLVGAHVPPPAAGPQTDGRADADGAGRTERGPRHSRFREKTPQGCDAVSTLNSQQSRFCFMYLLSMISRQSFITTGPESAPVLRTTQAGEKIPCGQDWESAGRRPAPAQVVRSRSPAKTGRRPCRQRGEAAVTAEHPLAVVPVTCVCADDAIAMSYSQSEGFTYRKIIS